MSPTFVSFFTNMCADNLSDQSTIDEILALIRNNHNFVRLRSVGGLFPLFRAILLRCCSDVILALIDAYPDALAFGAPFCEDIEIMFKTMPRAYWLELKCQYLPIHVAIGLQVDKTVISEMIRRMPASLRAFGTMEGLLPLHCAACCSNNVDVVREILNGCPDAISQYSSSGLLPLHLAAAKNSNPAVAKLLLDAYPEALRTCDRSGHERLPLHHAARSNPNAEVLYLLLNIHPAAAEIVCSHSNLMHLAAENPSVDVVRAVLNERPKDVCKLSSYLMMPLHIAARSNSNPEVVQLILNAYPKALTRWYEHIDKWNRFSLPLHAAATDNPNVDVVRLLLEAYPEAVRRQHEYVGWLPIHGAAANSKSAAVIHLLVDAFPESIRACDACEEQLLPIHYAAQNSCEAVARAVLEADPTAIRVRCGFNRKRFPLELAADTFSYAADVFRLLLEAYPEALNESTDDVSMHILHEIARRGCTAKLEVLLEHSIAVDVRDEYGRTALHHAVSSGNVEAVELLLRHGADSHSVDCTGASPIEFSSSPTMSALLRRVRRMLSNCYFNCLCFFFFLFGVYS